MAESCTTPEAQLILIAERIGGSNMESYTVYKFSFSDSHLYRVLSLSAIFPYNMGFFCVDDVIYMVGGEKYKKNRRKACKKVWELDISSGETKSLTSMGSGKSYPTCIGPLEDGLVYVFSNNLSSHACESFNPKTCKWNPLPPPPVPLDVNLNSNDSEIVGHQHSSSRKTIVITTKFRGKFNYHYDLHVWDSCNQEEPPVLTPQIPENLSFEARHTDLTLFYSSDSNRSKPVVGYPPSSAHLLFDSNRIKPVVGYPPSGAHLLFDRAAYLLSLGNRRFCTFRSGYEVSPFEDPYSNFKVCVNVFSLKEEVSLMEVKVDEEEVSLMEVKVDEEEVSVSQEIIEEESPDLWLHIRGCFALHVT